MEAKSRKLPTARPKVGRHGEYESPKKLATAPRRGIDPVGQKVVRATPKPQASVAMQPSPRTDTPSRNVTIASAARRSTWVTTASGQPDPAPSATPSTIQGPPWALAKLRRTSGAARKKTCSCGSGPTRAAIGGKATHTATCARASTPKAPNLTAARGAASCRPPQPTKTRRANFTDLAKPPVTAPPLQPLELVPLPEIEEGPVWWVWDAEFTLQRIGTQRAKVILPFEPAPPQYLTKPQQNFAEYSLPMLFWVQGEGQFFDQPPSFLREMTRLARRAGVAIVILEEDDQEYVSKRATRLVEAIRRTSEYDSQSTLTILRSGVTAKLRRIGDACVGGWSRGGRAAILACGGAASETIPKSIRPRRFISLAPEGGPMVSDPAASLNNLNLAGVTGLVVFSIADADVFSLATGTLMPQGGNLAFLRYWCVDHNAFMNAQSESGFKPPPWGTLSPPCHIPAPTEGGAGTLRRQLFARWGALAAVFAAEGEPAAVARASIFRNGLRGLGSQPHDLYFRREKGVQYGDVEKVATTTPQGKPTSVSWSRLKLESVKALSVASIGNAASPRLNTSDSPASATAQPFMLLDDGGRCVILIARAGKPYALNWTMTPSSLANRVAVSIAAYTQLSFANAGLPLENLGELIASGRLLMVPGGGADNPEFSLGLLRISVRSAGRQPGSPLGPVSTHVVSSNPIFASSTAKTNNAPMAAYYNTFVNSFDLGSPVSKSVNVHAEVTMRNTCILVFADPRLL